MANNRQSVNSSHGQLVNSTTIMLS